MRSSRLLLGCILLTTMITAALITALTSFWVQALVQAADDQLRHSNAMSMVISGQVNAPTATADDGVIRAAVHGAFGPVPYRLDGAVWSNPLGFGVPSHSGTRPPTAPGRVVKLIEAAALGQVTANAVLVAGAWPDPPGNGGPIPAALPAAAASRLHAGPGTVFTLYDRDTGRRVRIRVTGLFRPRNPRALYWGLDSLGTSAVSVTPPFVTYGPLAVSPGAFGHGGLAVGQASWVALPDAAHIGGDITGLAARLSNAEAFFRNTASLGGLQVSSGVPQALTATGLNLGVARSLLTIGGLQFLLLAAAALTLPARLLASHRDEESALLSARGARRWQLVSPGLAEALLLAGTAVIAGALAGSRLAGLLVDTHSLQAAGLRVTGTPAALWWAALAVLVLCTVIMLGTALKPAPPGEVRIRRGRQAAVAAAARAGGDLSLLALAVVAILELRTYSPVAHPAAGGIGIDPVAVIAPALALAGATLIPLRALPALAKVADRLAGRTRRLGAALASWEISRRPVRQSGPLLLVVLAVATGTLALTQRASWQQSAQDQAAYAVGSDVSVTTQKPATLSTAGAVAGAPGVRAATPVTQVSLDSGGEVIALDARAAAAAVSLRPDLSPLPPRALWGRITPSEPHTGLALPGHPERLGLTVTLTSREGTAAPWPVVATVQDAHGIDYTLGAGALTADGHTHQLITDLAGTRGAAYPLRLLGVSLTYPLPTFAASQHVQPAASGTATLTVVSLAAAYSANGPFSPPFAQGDALASWQAALSSPELTSLAAVGYASPGSVGQGVQPKVLTRANATGGAVSLHLLLGEDPESTVMQATGYTQGDLQGVLSLAAPTHAKVIPAIATSSFLHATHVGQGAIVPVTVNGVSVPLQVVATVTGFPAVTGRSGGAGRGPRDAAAGARQQTGSPAAGVPAVAADARRGDPGRPANWFSNSLSGTRSNGPAHQPAVGRARAGGTGDRGGLGAAGDPRLLGQRGREPAVQAGAAGTADGTRCVQGGTDQPALPGAVDAEPASGRHRPCWRACSSHTWWSRRTPSPPPRRSPSHLCWSKCRWAGRR